MPCVLIAALRSGADLYHLHDPELIPAGLLLKAIGKKVVFDSHERVAFDILDKEYLPWGVKHLLYAMAKALISAADRWFDGIVAATDGVAADFRNKNTRTVNNYPEWSQTEGNSATLAQFMQRRPVVAYVGHITAKRGIREMVSAVELVNQKMPVTLALAGVFDPPELEESIRAMSGWKYVEFHGMLGRPQVKTLLSSAVGGLVVLHPTINFIKSNPIKLYEYLFSGLPVIVSTFAEWQQLISSAQVAQFVDPTNPKEIADSILWILGNRESAWQMGQRGRAVAEARFTWSTERVKLIDLYRDILYRSDPEVPRVLNSETTGAQSSSGS